MPDLALRERSSVVVEIGGLPIRLNCGDPDFVRLLEHRYSGYLGASCDTALNFDIALAPPGAESSDDDLAVTVHGGRWLMQRGDFRAEWDSATTRGSVEQTINPYSLDSVLRIVHTLLLARSGGFLVHASSAIRNGRAFLFSGISGAGKTTMARLAPADVTLLTDEISYVTRQDDSYVASGTPFYGELARPGANERAPIRAFYLLAKGKENRIEPILDPSEAVRRLLGNILFFARDPELVKLVFDSSIDFVSRVPVRVLTFRPDQRVWDLIR